jgi:hypothetical protein
MPVTAGPGRKTMTLAISEELHKRMRMIAFGMGLDLSKVFAEALTDWCEKHADVLEIEKT